MFKVKTIEWHKRAIVWGYITLAILAFLMAIFTAFVDLSSLEGGGKGGFYLAILIFIGSLLAPVFGQYGTSVVFLIIGIFLLFIWHKKRKHLINIEYNHLI